LSRTELASLYERAGGFLHIGEEDFGITMVEALATGTPVIALDRGGSRDIVEPGVSGVLVSDPNDLERLREAIRAVAGTKWDRAVLRESAERFSESRFREGFKRELRRLGAE